MDFSSAIINDLVSDSSKNTTQQLVAFVKDRQDQRSWPKRVIPLTPELSDLKTDNRIKVRLNSLVRLLFDAKTQLDSDGVTDVILITSRVMKKVWERLCYLLFSHIHNWTVVGVDVTGQDVGLTVPREKDVDRKVQNFLRGLKSPDDVLVLKPDVFPENLFNAGFSTRRGGVSCLKPLASLNVLHTVRKADPVVVVEENQRRLAQKAGFQLETLNVAKVEHGAKIWVVEKPEERPIKYDGVVTNTPGVTVAAPGADCSMILLADPKTGACGAVHAGWMGTTKGAVRSLLRTMVEEYGTRPCDVLAAVGPSIEGNCFTLPTEDVECITNLDPSLTWPHSRVPGICHIDLVRANAVMLEIDGVPANNIDLQEAKCTVCHEDLFFSHRRDGIPFGNQIGYIQRVEHSPCHNKINAEM